MSGPPCSRRSMACGGGVAWVGDGHLAGEAARVAGRVARRQPAGSPCTRVPDAARAVLAGPPCAGRRPVLSLGDLGAGRDAPTLLGPLLLDPAPPREVSCPTAPCP